MPRKEVWRLKKILASFLVPAFLMTGLAMTTASAKAGDPHEMSTKTTHSKKATPKPKTHSPVKTGWDLSPSVKKTPKPKSNAFDSYMGKHQKAKMKPKPKATHKP